MPNAAQTRWPTPSRSRLAYPPRRPWTRPSATIALWLALSSTSVAACSGDAVVDPDGTSQTGSGGTTGTSTSTSTNTGTATGTGTGTGTGGSSALQMRVSDISIGIDCMPVVGPDPVYVGFEAEYDNSNGTAPGQATITQARAQLGSGALMLTWTYDVTPPGSGSVQAGETLTLLHEKVAGSGSGDAPVSPCDFCAAPGAVLLLDVDLDGNFVSFQHEADSYGCAY